MFEILEKRLIAPEVHKYVISAPLVAAKAQAGNFVIVRINDTGERIPITIADHDSGAGTLTLVVQEVGKTTRDMAMLEVGDVLLDLLGPLGSAAEIEAVADVLAVCGGIGVAPTLPLIRAYHDKGARIVTIVGARSRELLILRDEIEEVSAEVIYTTDDGSYGIHGFVTGPLRELLEAGRKFDQAIAIGPAPMMQAACKITAEYNLPTMVSLNSIMVDGTGMCGGCRVSIGGKTKFTCVDGPGFDGHQVDFQELISRQAYYRDEEKQALHTEHHGEDECAWQKQKKLG